MRARLLLGKTGHLAATLLRFDPSAYGNRAAPSSKGLFGRLILLLLVCACVVPGCASGRGDGPRPSSTLASSGAAQREFRALHERWLVGSDVERRRLEPQLRKFVARHGGDARARLARLYLAWILIQRGDLSGARQLVERARSGPEGSAHDFADVAQAAILVREGKPAQALDLLDPLNGKIVDAEERLLYGEQCVLAAMAARRHEAAVGYALEWLAEAPAEDREAVGGRIGKMVSTVPADALERTLRALDLEARTGSAPGREGARDWLRKAIRERLVGVALERRDPELARRLLEEGPPSLRGGQRGNELQRLAVSGAVVPRVAGRAIGFVLSLGSPSARRASADAAAGIARALGLPERDADPNAVRLITADDGGAPGGVQTALAQLAGDGASVLIAGVDESSAMEAKAYADSAAIPVIVLAPLEALEPGGFTFSVGADVASQESALSEEITRRGVSSPARVGRGGVPCDSALTSAGTPRFPIATWRRDRVDALVVLGDAACARRVVSELSAAGSRPLLAFGLECAELLSALETPHRRFAIATGRFPLREGGPSSEGMKRWRDRTGSPPGWVAALGHDAALLASTAIGDFALERVDDARAVSELHRRAQKKLATARAELWTSDKKGFEGGRRLSRTLSIAASGKNGH